ncbi:hypothetical protein [Streptomyces sp. NBC_00286]|uniref:hypothetical protein n=1 Tax=Streptomyces sp. NBC_00286 TaxID=2975701 RepID=UPI003FA70756
MPGRVHLGWPAVLFEARTWFEEEGVGDLDDTGARPQFCHEDTGVLQVGLAAVPQPVRGQQEGTAAVEVEQ